jgi:hypothetical protein
MPDEFNSNAERCRHVAMDCHLFNLRGDARPIIYRAARDGVSARYIPQVDIEEMIRSLKTSDVKES